MTLLNPLGLLMLLAIPVLIILHLFRQERRRQEVSSLILWREISDQQSRRVRPRLLRNVNLLLQLIAVLFASLALAQPSLQSRDVIRAGELILLVDDSASMAADVDGISRMEIATNRAREIIGRTRRDTRVLIASAGPAPSIEHAHTTDRDALYETLRQMVAVDGAGDIAGAFALARGVSFGESTDTILITDGAFVLPSGERPPPNFTASLVGGDKGNLGITAFELRSQTDGSRIEAFVQIGNYTPAAQEVVFELQADREILVRESLELGAGEVVSLAYPLPRRRGTLFEGRLVDNEDALAADDRAFAVAAGARPVRVQLVTSGNIYLESLLSVYPNVDLTITRTVDQTSAYDLLILDGVPAPARLLGSVISLGAVIPDGPLTLGELVEPTRSVATVETHPVMRDVNLANLNVRSAQSGSLSLRATVLARSGDIPLIYTLSTNQLNLVALSFRIVDSDLPLRSAFPVLMHNMIEYLAPVTPSGEVGYKRSQEAVSIYVPVGEEVVIIDPAERPFRETPRTSPYQFSTTDTVGIYQVRGESFSDRFAVSLASPQESNLKPRFIVEQSPASAGQATTRSPGAPIWHWFALITLLALAAEWVVWARRT